MTLTQYQFCFDVKKNAAVKRGSRSMDPSVFFSPILTLSLSYDT